MRYILPPIIMLAVGLSLGAGLMTAYWSPQLTASHKLNAEFLKIADQWRKASERFESINTKNEKTLRECLDYIRRRT